MMKIRAGLPPNHYFKGGKMVMTKPTQSQLIVVVQGIKKGGLTYETQIQTTGPRVREKDILISSKQIGTKTTRNEGFSRSSIESVQPNPIKQIKRATLPQTRDPFLPKNFIINREPKTPVRAVKCKITGNIFYNFGRTISIISPEQVFTAPVPTNCCCADRRRDEQNAILVQVFALPLFISLLYYFQTNFSLSGSLFNYFISIYFSFILMVPSTISSRTSSTYSWLQSQEISSLAFSISSLSTKYLGVSQGKTLVKLQICSPAVRIGMKYSTRQQTYTGRKSENTHTHRKLKDSPNTIEIWLMGARTPATSVGDNSLIIKGEQEDIMPIQTPCTPLQTARTHIFGICNPILIMIVSTSTKIKHCFREQCFRKQALHNAPIPPVSDIIPDSHP